MFAGLRVWQCKQTLTQCLFNVGPASPVLASIHSAVVSRPTSYWPYFALDTAYRFFLFEKIGLLKWDLRSKRFTGNDLVFRPTTYFEKSYGPLELTCCDSSVYCTYSIPIRIPSYPYSACIVFFTIPMCTFSVRIMPHIQLALI